MNCSQAQKQTHNYHEDLLPESLWAEMRGHFSVCEACREYLLRQSHLSSDLKRLYFSPSPFDMVPIFEAALALRRQNKKLFSGNKFFPLIVLVLCALVFWQAFLLLPRPAERPTQIAPKRTVSLRTSALRRESNRKAAAALKTLVTIAAKLEKNPEAEDPALPVEIQQPLAVPVKKRVSYVNAACIQGECSELKISDTD